ncbi:MAG: hypothetical protein KJ574_02865 [Nanoarchaeota archaeon]|nr:hypothetical protein [Nanoarchaeota archaeon]
MTPEEFIEQELAKLKDPVRYFFTGEYLYHGAEQQQRGFFYIGAQAGKEDNLVGRIFDDGSNAAAHVAKGRVLSRAGIQIIKFLKIPTGMNANIAYVLAKKATKDITGHYEGFWSFAEPSIESALAVIMPRGGGIFIRPSRETENRVTLELLSP